MGGRTVDASGEMQKEADGRSAPQQGVSERISFLELRGLGCVRLIGLGDDYIF